MTWAGKRGDPSWVWLLIGALCQGCPSGKHEEAEAAAAKAQPVTLGQENLAEVRSQRLESGPAISGNLTAVQSATLRAEVGGALLEVGAERGETVKAGDVLARIEATSSEDQVRAARVGLQSAEDAQKLAVLDHQRNVTLAEKDVISARERDHSKTVVAQSEAQLAQARAQLAQALQLSAHSEVKAPFDGVISERAVHAGDVVQPGTPLFTLVDLTRLQLEASVPSQWLASLRPGTPVDFTVNGFSGQTFQGRIERLNPVVDPTTGQVRIYVTLPNPERRLVVGLFAQGRVATQSKEALAAPASAVDTSSTPPTVLRLQEGKVERVPVKVGLRDEMNERVELRSGVSAGDQLVLGNAQNIPEGEPVKVRQDTPSPKQGP